MADEHWLLELYQTHKRVLVLVAWNILNDQAAAEDAVHGAIVRLAQLAEQPNDARAFAIRTVRNVAIDMVRKRNLGREQAWEETSSVVLESETDIADERHTVIQNALLQIDANDRELIRLHLQAGLTFQQIADALGAPLQTIASRYRRAIAKLRSIIEVKYE